MQGKPLSIGKAVQDSNVIIQLRKAYTKPDLKSHNVLTEDIFTYVDFYFLKKNKKLKDENGKRIKQNYRFYWEQAHNFYKAAKNLPIEASPLLMYYCMLNAAKAYILYQGSQPQKILESFKTHGLRESKYTDSCHDDNLSDIKISRTNNGVFPCFSQLLDKNFDKIWKNGNDSSYSVGELMQSLAFVHNSYVATNEVRRKNEAFIPLVAGESPTFHHCSDKKIHLIVKLQRSYFNANAVCIPEDIMNSVFTDYTISSSDPFCLIHNEPLKKSDIKEKYADFRSQFSYISAPKKLWYFNKTSASETAKINNLSKIMAITHRISEIVRYKPEQMINLLNGKENWLLHEFLSLALDQFIDEIACEITKHEIMQPKYK